MKILIIIEASGAGVGKHVMDLVEGLSHFEDEIHLLYSPIRTDKVFKNRLGTLDSKIILKSVNMYRNISIIKDLRSFKEILRYIDGNGPFDIIHGHSSKAGFLGRLAGALKKTKTIYTPHAINTMDPGNNKFKYMVYLFLEKLAGHWTNKIIAVSNNEADHIVSHGIVNSNKIAVIPNGINKFEKANDSNIRIEFNIPDNRIIVGFIGRLCYQKAPEILIDAIHKINDSDFHFIFIGDGEYFLDLVEQTKNDDNITFVGFRSDINNILSQIDIFCLSSRYEGMPYVLLEAMAAGLPIVSTKVSGTEMLIQGEGGILVPIDNSDEIANAIKQVKSQEVRQRMSIHNLARSDSFTVENMVKQTRNLYESVLNERVVS